MCTRGRVRSSVHRIEPVSFEVLFFRNRVVSVIVSLHVVDIVALGGDDGIEAPSTQAYRAHVTPLE